MSFLSFMADPIGVHRIIEPSGQGSENSGDRQADNARRIDREAQMASMGRGASNASSSASSAGSNAAAQHWYSQGSDWQPGMPTPQDPSTKAYQTWQAYVNAQGGASAAASAAGSNATAQHHAQEAQKRAATEAADQAARDKAGLDMMKPGATEDFYAKHGAEMTAPGSYKDWWNQNGAQMQSPGMAENYANSVLQKYSGGSQVPPADYGTYYDRAATKATQGLNDQLSSRGQYGSSVGLGLIGTQLADLAAQRARDEADYGLKRSADERSWASALSDVAQTGDASSLARWNAGGQGAALADTVGLARWKAAQGAANDAQSAQRQRGQDYFNNERGIGGDLSALAGSAYGGNLSTDSSLLDAITALMVGQKSEGVAGAQAGANQDAANQNQIMQLLQAYALSQSQGAKK